MEYHKFLHMRDKDGSLLYENDNSPAMWVAPPGDIYFNVWVEMIIPLYNSLENKEDFYITDMITTNGSNIMIKTTMDDIFKKYNMMLFYLTDYSCFCCKKITKSSNSKEIIYWKHIYKNHVKFCKECAKSINRNRSISSEWYSIKMEDYFGFSKKDKKEAWKKEWKSFREKNILKDLNI